jgi:hypothetical protein
MQYAEAYQFPWQAASLPERTSIIRQRPSTGGYFITLRFPIAR